MYYDFSKPALNKEQKSRIKSLYKRDNYNGFISITKDVIWIAVSILICTNISYWFLCVSLIVIGARQRALASLLHEAAHGTLFSSKILNETIGRVLCGWTILQSFSAYKNSHVHDHHPKIGEKKEDPDLAYMMGEGVYDDQTRSQFFLRYLVMPILGMRTPHYVWFLIRDRLLGSLIDIRFRLETSSLIIMHISFFILALWVGFALELVIFWWLPYVMTYTVIGWLSELSEHFPMMPLHTCRYNKSNSVTTELVTSKRAMAGVSQLWRKVYAEEFNWSLNDPETDGYHERSAYYIAWLNDNIPAGTIRIVSAQDQGFHITDNIDIAEILTKNSPNFIEVQRLMVCEEHRDKRYLGAPFGIYGCMVKACLHHVIAHSIDTIIADCHVNMKISPMKSMLQMGFIDTGKTYIDALNGEVCAVLTINAATWLRNTYNRPTPFNRYLLDFDEWSIVQPNLHASSQLTVNEQLSSMSA